MDALAQIPPGDVIWWGRGCNTLFGPGPDIAIATNAIFALVLLIATYGLGRHLFSPQVGILAAG